MCTGLEPAAIAAIVGAGAAVAGTGYSIYASEKQQKLAKQQAAKTESLASKAVARGVQDERAPNIDMLRARNRRQATAANNPVPAALLSAGANGFGTVAKSKLLGE